MPIEDIANVTVLVQETNVTQVGFGTPLVVGHFTSHPEVRVLSYASSSWDTALIADGIPATNSIYQCVEQMMKQEVKPTHFKVGRRSAPDQQVLHIAPGVIATTGLHTVWLEAPDGTVYYASYVEDGTPTVAKICTGLAASITGLAIPGLTANGASGTAVILTFPTGEVWSVHGLQASDVLTDQSAMGGVISADLSAIRAEDDDWYGVCLASAVPATCKAVADWVETTGGGGNIGKIFIAGSHDGGMVSNSTTDLASYIKTNGYVRSHAHFYRKATRFNAACWMAKMLAYEPGTANWKFQTLEGCETDKLTATQWGYLKGKNGSYYEGLRGVSLTGAGKTGGGRFLDVTQIVDWVKARMQEGLLMMLTAGPKVPFTDEGVGNQTYGVCKSVLERGQQLGSIDTDPKTWKIHVPKVRDVPLANRQEGNFTGTIVNFRATGAVNQVDVTVYIAAA